jgi:aryl-alcohol dehydrogenase-like predicted oxidoreductase
LLRTARSRGVTTFEIPEGPGSVRAERQVATAFPGPDKECLVLVERSFSSLVDEGARAPPVTGEATVEARLRRSIRDSELRLRPQSIGILEWRQEADSGLSLADAVVILDVLRSEGLFAGWALTLPPDGTLPAPPEFRTGRAPLFAGFLSLLQPRSAGPFTERAKFGPMGVFVRDPLGGGRLDGTRFSRSIGDRTPESRPVDLRELHREFDPVLRLGFLTTGRGRTMAQAALQFLYHWPWVCSALVPIPGPERLEELARSEATPPFSEDDIERVLSAAA